MNNTVFYGKDEYGVADRMTNLENEKIDSFNNVEIGKVQSFLKELKDSKIDPNREKLYLFMRMTNAEKIKFLNDKVLNGDIITDEIKFNADAFKRQDLKEKYKKTLNTLNEFSKKGKLEMDIDFLTKTRFKTLNVEGYTTILDKIGISLSEYRALRDIDIIIVGDDVSVKPKEQPKYKESIVLNTERSSKHKKAKLQAISPKVTGRLAKFLNDRFENSTVEIMSVGDILTNYPDVDISDRSEAFVNVGNSTIVLIKERATLDVLLHEMGHLYLAELKDKDLALYKNLMKKMEDSEIIDSVNEAYSNKFNYTKDDILEEAFVITLKNLYSKDFVDQYFLETKEEFDGILDKGGKHLGSITKFFSDMFHKFYGVRVKKDTTINMKDSILDIMRKIGTDLIFNKNSVLSSMSRNDIKNLKIILKDKNMTEQEAEGFLIKKGLIRKFCK